MELEINGARILTVLPFFGGIPITETMVNTWLLMAALTLTAWFLTRDLRTRDISRRQAAAERLVLLLEGFVQDHLSEAGEGELSFIGALFALSIFGSLSALVGAFAPTADLNTTLAWALTVFAIVTVRRIRRGGLGGYLKGFTRPISLLTPFNVLSELSTPVSMAFRHFGNIVSGSVILALIYAALASASGALFGLLPGALGEVLGEIPLLSVGVPAFLSLYFDWFSAFMQAFIFCILTLLYLRQANDTARPQKRKKENQHG